MRFLNLTTLHLVLVLSVLLATLAQGRAEPDSTPDIVEETDIRYSDVADRNQLDIFRPAKGKGFPVVVFIHGGSWTLGDKNLFGLYRSVGKFLARHQMVGVMVNYRLSPQVKHPEHIRDVAKAYTWVRKNIEARGGNPDRIYLAGHSAGAHLVSLLATDDQYLKAPDLKLNASDFAAIRGIISICGVYRIPGREEYREMADEMLEILTYIASKNPSPATQFIVSLAKSSKNFDLMQMVFGNDQSVRDQASPLRHIKKGLPPFLILHAEFEIPKLEPMAREFRDALLKEDVPVTFCPIEGHSHNTIAFRLNRQGDPTAKAILEFISKTEKNLKSP